MRVAHALASQSLPTYSNKFSRKDLHAAAAVRVPGRPRAPSGRPTAGVEALLRDAGHWCRDIGMTKVAGTTARTEARRSQHGSCRAFHALNLGRRSRRLPDVLAQWFAVAPAAGGRRWRSTPASTNTHHRSRHYEQRRRHFAATRQTHRQHAAVAFGAAHAQAGDRRRHAHATLILARAPTPSA